MIRIMISRFLVVLLVLTVYAHQVASQITPYFPSLRNNDPSYASVVVALICSFLFVLFFSFYLRRCSDTNLTVADRLEAAATAATVNCTPREPQGIDSKLLDTFPILMYSNLKDLRLSGSVPLECAMCLTEFEPDDTLRLLPICNHVFHPDCIRMWLASQATCPVCRAVLKPRNVEEEVAVVIQNEANEPPEEEEEEEVGDSSAARRTTMTTRTEVSCGERELRRCHSTGHLLDLRLRREDYVRKEIMGWSIPTNSDTFQGHEDDEGSSGGR